MHGNSGPPLIGKTIGALLDEVSATDGSRDALIVTHQKIRWTYAELKMRSDAFASGLLALGLEPGDRVGIWAPNCAEWTITQFATAKAGLILVNVNPAYRTSEAEYALNKVGCAALVTAVRHKSSEYLGMLTELKTANKLPDLRLVITIGEDFHPGCLRFGDIAGEADLATLGARLQFDDAINIQFTS